MRLAPSAEFMRKKNTAVLNFFIGCQSQSMITLRASRNARRRGFCTS
jgi:hypothetical protein